jgi:biotin carboxylase
LLGDFEENSVNVEKEEEPMSILILNAVSHADCPYDELLADLGEELVLLTDSRYAEGFPKQKYAYIEAFDSYDVNSNVELRAIELYETYQYHTVIALKEMDIIRAASIRDWFDLKGQRSTSAEQYRDKVRMKEVAGADGIPVTKFRRIHSSFDLIQFVKEYDFPVVIKPILGRGSTGTCVLEDKTALSQFIEKGVPLELAVEKFVEGEVYHVDGIVQEGRLDFISASKYYDAPLHFHTTNYQGAFLLTPTSSIAERLVDMTKKLIASLDTPDFTTFHAEWFHTPDDQIVLVEIASRTGGGRIAQMNEHAFGANLLEASLRLQCGQTVPVPTLEKQKNPDILAAWMILPPHKGTLRSLPTGEPPNFVVEYKTVGKIGQNYNDPVSQVDHIASFVVEGENEELLQERAQAAFEWFHQSTSWD